MPWKAVAVVAPPPLQSAQDDDVAFFGLEELDGSYRVVDGQLVVDDGAASAELSSSQPPPARAEAKKTKQKRKAQADDAPTHNDAGDDAAAAATTTHPKKKKNPAAADTLAAPKPPRVSTVEDLAAIAMEGSPWQALGLYPSLCAALVSRLGFGEPTPIQALSIPAAVSRGKDVLGAAETGSGKTLAYGLPVLDSLLRQPPKPEDGLACLILTPTRELAMQVVQHLRAVLACEPLETRPRVEALVGGMALVKQQRVLARKPAVVVATVGRLMAIVKDGDAHVADLSRSLRFLVLDEADRMVDKAHYADVLPVVELLKRGANRHRQVFLFSATLLSRDSAQARAVDGLMADLAQRGSPELCNVAALSSSATAAGAAGEPQTDAEDDAQATAQLPASLKLAQISCTEEEKPAMLYYFCTQYAGSTLVFVNTIAQAKRVAGVLNLLLPRVSEGPACLTLHANMEQRQRLKHLDRFRLGGRVLVATDVAARGLDVPRVDHVVQFSVPTRAETFVHRAGRTARAGESGLVVALVSGQEIKAFARLERELAVSVAALPVEQSLLPRVKTRVKLATRLQAAQSKEHNASLDKQWLVKAAKDMDIALDDDDDDAPSRKRRRGGGGGGDDDDDDDGDSGKRRARELARLRAQLDALLSEELWPRGRSRVFVAGAPASQELLEAGRGQAVKRKSAVEDLARSPSKRARNRRAPVM